MARQPWQSKAVMRHQAKVRAAENPELAKELKRRRKAKKAREESLNGPVRVRKATPEEMADW